MSYLIPQLITVVVYWRVMKSINEMDVAHPTSALMWIPPIFTALISSPVWLIFYCIELVFYK